MVTSYFNEKLKFSHVIKGDRGNEDIAFEVLMSVRIRKWSSAM
jgi:hypothetical protein